MQKLQGTILDFDLKKKQEEIFPEKMEIDLDFLKKLYKNQLREDLQKKIDRGNNLLNKWSQTREDVKPSIAVKNHKSTGKLKTNNQGIGKQNKKKS